MKTTTLQTSPSILFKLKLFFALSRTPHMLLDLATPAFAALLWHGSFPSMKIIMLGLITTFAGYSAVYALNDLVDHRVDKKRVDDGLLQHIQNDLDGIFVRHPIAHGLLPLTTAMLWTAAWSLLALVGSYLLNPFCAVIFLASCLLESIYCLLWKTTYLKVIISGTVKTSGAIAAVYAVDQTPSFSLLTLLFLWLFFWEIGGQNIPNDWADIKEDRILQATTIPVRFGPVWTSRIILISLLSALILSAFPFILLSKTPRPYEELAVSLIIGVYLLLLPAYRLYRTKDRIHAQALFNHASYYPLALLGLIILAIII